MDRAMLRDFVLSRLWTVRGGSPFRPVEALGGLTASACAQLAGDDYRGPNPWQSAAKVLGLLLADAADNGYRSAAGLGVARRRPGVYAIVRRGALTVLEVGDRAAARVAMDEIGRRLAAVEAECAAGRVALAGLFAAFERDDATGDARDDDEEALGAIARAHGDAWRTTRTLAAIVGRDKASIARFRGLVGRPIEGMVLEERRGAHGWREYRVTVPS